MKRREPDRLPIPTTALALGTLLAAGWLVWPASVAGQEPPDPFAGTWQGTLQVPGGGELRVVFHIAAEAEGGLTATLDSPDQGATGIPVSQVKTSGDTLRLQVASIGGAYEGVLAASGDTVSGVWSQGGVSLDLDLGKTTADQVEGPERPQEPEPPFPYRVQEVSYENAEAGIELAGTLTLPEGEEPVPGVLLVSGSGPQDRDETVFGHRPFLVLADHLTRRGIAVLRMDDRGVGESGGDFSQATSEDFASDALAGVRYLREHPGVDPGSVGIVGHSEGGLIAPMVGSRSDNVAFLVLLAGPGLPGQEILYLQGEKILRAMGGSEAQVARQREQQAELFRVVKEEEDPERRLVRLKEVLRARLHELSPAERAATGTIPEDSTGLEAWLDLHIRSASSPWFRFFLLHDPRPVLRRVSVPVLAMIGELDLQVPPDENLPEIEKALVRGGNRDVTVMKLDGLNHLFQHAESGAPTEYSRIVETMAPEAMEAIAQWILARARSGTAGQR